MSNLLALFSLTLHVHPAGDFSVGQPIHGSSAFVASHRLGPFAAGVRPVAERVYRVSN